MIWGPREHDGRERLEATPEAIAIVEAHLGATGAQITIAWSMSKTSLEHAVKAGFAAAVKANRGAREGGISRS